MTKVRDRDQVIDAAARVFAEKGYEAARLEDIATELGIQQGSLYYYVASKAELLFLVQRRPLLIILERLEGLAAAALPPREKLMTAVRDHLLHIDAHYPQSSQWFVTPALAKGDEAGYAELRQLNRRYVELFTGLVTACAAAGELRAGLEPAIVARAIIGMCNWTPRWYRQGGAEPMDAIARMLVAMVTEGAFR